MAKDSKAAPAPAAAKAEAKKPAAAAAAPAATKKASSKKPSKAAAPAEVKTPSVKFPARKRSQGLGGDILPKGRDLGRFVRWPRYVRLQRQKKILQQRLKVPPALNQFHETAPANQVKEVFKILNKYRPETKSQKKERLTAAAKAQASGGKAAETKAPAVVKMGLKHVTALVEQKKAKLVVIAADVDPIELVVWLPALCRKMEVPYMIVQNKGRLGEVVHKKTAAVLAVTRVEKEDEAALKTVCESAKALFNDNADARKKWGGGKMGERTNRKVAAHDAAVAAERAKKLKMMG